MVLALGLYGSLNLFDVTWSAWHVGLHRTCRGHRALALRVATAALHRARGHPAPLTVLPNLVVEETYQFEVYRTLVSLSALIALYFGLGALALWVMFREWLEGRVVAGRCS